ncbi:MAG TPA: LacI family DNA-binding transcriptional regulator [Bacillota bacterium]|nr:LacI family DNA-binding transcriptional regulator [Bacillota bacterium]
MATIKDIAKETNLSLGTISKFINGGNVLEENRVLIETAIKKFDFKVNELARGLKTNRTMVIGVLIPSLGNIFCTSIISNIENILLQNGYGAIICDYKEDPVLEYDKLTFLLNKMVDGIVMMPLKCDERQVTDIIAKGTPVVLIDRMIQGVNCDVVLVDNLNASYNAVEHLITNGHKRIGIITGPENIYTAQERLKGYIRVHEDYAMGIDHNLVKYGDYHLQSGYDSLLQLLNLSNPPTAVYVTNYEMTLGAIIAINERNLKIPDDLSFIGFDNLELARIVKPSLSIVVQPVEQIGETAAQILLRRLKGDQIDFPVVERLKTSLLIKESVRNLKANLI